MAQVYANQSKTKGIDLAHPVQEQEAIYQQYLAAFKKGAYNVIKEEVDLTTGHLVPRKYFSGGFHREGDFAQVVHLADAAMAKAALRPIQKRLLSVGVTLQSAPATTPRADRAAVALDLTDEQKAKFSKLMARLAERENPLVPGSFWFKQHVFYPFEDPFGGIEMVRAMFDLLNVPPQNPQDGIMPSDTPALLDRLEKLGLITLEERQALLTALNGKTDPTTGKHIDGLWDIFERLILKHRSTWQYDIEEVAFWGRAYGNSDFPEKALGKYLEETYGIVLPTEPKEFKEALLEQMDRHVLDYYHLTFQIYSIFSRVLSEVGHHIFPPTFKDPRTVTQDWVDVLRQKPAQILDVFHAAVKRRELVPADQVEAIAALAQDPTLMINEENRKEMGAIFVDLLSSKNPISLVLNQMQDAGVLQWVLPGLPKLDHHYGSGNHWFTITRHTLYLLYLMERPELLMANVKRDKFAQNIDAIEQLLKFYMDRESSIPRLTFRLAMLLHDAQKDENYEGFNEPHPIGGDDRLIPGVFSRLPDAKTVQNDVGWLVRHHQEIPDRIGTAVRVGEKFFYSDLLDIFALSNQQLNSDTWNLLYLLTVADGMAENPMAKRFTSYPQANAMHEEMSAYFTAEAKQQKSILADWKTRAGKERDEWLARSNTPAFKQETLREAKALEMHHSLGLEDFIQHVDENFNELYAQYTNLFSFNHLKHMVQAQLASQLARYAYVRRVARLNGGPAPVAQEIKTTVSQISSSYGTLMDITTFLSYDRPGIMYRIMGVLSAIGLNILDSRAYTSREGVVVDNMQAYFIERMDPQAFWNGLARKHQLEAFEFKNWEELIPRLMYLVISNDQKRGTKGHVTVEDLFEAGPIKAFAKIQKDVTEPLKVEVKTDLDRRATHLTVAGGGDRNGLAYILGKVLTEKFKVNIEQSPMSTLHSGVLDDFYLTKMTRRGKRLLREGEMTQIRDYLSALLSFKEIPVDWFNGGGFRTRVTMGLPLSAAEQQYKARLEREGKTFTSPLQLSEALKERASNAAMIDHSPKTRGGIDFNARLAEKAMRVTTGGPTVATPKDASMLRNLRAVPGLRPVIMYIRPAHDVLP